MTKHRPPLSVDAALARIAGQLERGWADMAACTGRGESYMRACGDPDRREKLAIEDAIVLDLAFQAAGGIGAPVYEAYTWRLEQAALERFSRPAALLQLAPEVIRENAEAEAAIIVAARPDATDRQVRETEREIDEAIARLQQVRHALRPSPLPPPDDPEAHKTGPPG